MGVERETLMRPIRRRRSVRGPRRPEAVLPYCLKRTNIYILPNRFGLIFLALLSGMLVGSFNHNNNLGFLLTFLLFGMMLISVLYTYRNLIGLRITSVKAQPVFQNQTAVFEVYVAASSPPRPSVDFALPQSSAVSVDLPGGGGDARVSLKVSAQTRGLLQAGPLTISTGYPFGLFRAWSRVDIDLQCLVYPRPVSAGHPLADLPGDAGSGLGRLASAGTDDFEGLRAYQPGDPLRHVSWKHYARGQSLYTKMFNRPADAAVRLDYNDISDPDPERRLSILCRRLLHANSLNLIYALNLPGRRIDAARGEAHKRSCLKALALFGSAQADG